MGTGRTETCPTCGESFSRVGSHWNHPHSSCGYPELTERQREIVTGLIMGDAYIYHTDKDNPSLRCEMANRPFLEWLDDEFGYLSTGVHERSSSSEHSFEGTMPTFEFRTRSHPAFEEWLAWYEDGEKVFPDDLSLTPELVRIWYACDGSLGWRENSDRPDACIACTTQDPEYLLSLFSEIGFENHVYSGDSVYFRVDETERFLEYIGDPPPGFAYKWVTDGMEEYRAQYADAYSA